MFVFVPHPAPRRRRLDALVAGSGQDAEAGQAGKQELPGAGSHGQDPAGAAEDVAAPVPGQVAGPRLEYQ
jgi:hypothetical protein